MTENLRSLAIGEMLSDYRIDAVLGQGGFGITYLGYDVMLDRRVAIKEYYPREFAVRDSTLTVHAAGNQEDKDTFKWGLEQFLKEAKLLAKLNHPNIIAVRRFFEANGTAYFVMDYCEGKPLDDLIKINGVLTLEQVNKLIHPILDGLEHLHGVNFLHRDIKPANIYIKSDGSPVLLDFGAARQEIVSHSRSVTSLATPGYASFEQYSTKGNQGPWTDIYGLAATLYRAVTGEKPQDSPDRILQDTLTPAAVLSANKYPDGLLKAIDKGMAVRPEERPQKISEWRELFGPTNAIPKKVRTNDVSSLSEDKEVGKNAAPEAADSPIKISKARDGTSNNIKFIFAGLALVAIVVIGWIFLVKSPSTSNALEKGAIPVPIETKKDNSIDAKPQVISVEAMVTEASELIKSGQLAKAEPIIQEVISKYPDNSKAHYLAAQLYVRQGKLGAARTELSMAEKLAPGLPFVEPVEVQKLQAKLRVDSRPPTAPAADPAAPAAPATPTLDLNKIVKDAVNK